MPHGSFDAPSSRAATGISNADEKRIARDLSPSVAWPTLFLAVALPSSFAAFVYAGFAGLLPLWLCALCLSPISYSHYTLVHESVHNNVVSKPRSLAWINTLVGWIGSLGLGIGWPALQRTHILHHSHTNTERDPDIFVKGTLLQLLAKWLRGLPTALIPMFLVRFIDSSRYSTLEGVFTRSEIVQTSAVTLGSLALLIAAVATGHVAEWFCLWFIPTRIGILLLNIFFQWLPHHPFDHTERYLNTRISLWPGGTPLLLGQNLHLVHHLWPSVPFYNYMRLFRALRPVLVAEDSRIEGLMLSRKI